MAQFIIHTGSIIKEYLDARNISQRDLARQTGLTEKHISNMLTGKVRITEETALKLEKVMPDIPAGYWISYEGKYREYLARQEEEHAISKLDLKELAKRLHFKEVFKNTDLSLTEMALEMLKILGVTSFDYIPEIYKHTSVAYMEDGGDPEAQIVWLQLCRTEIEAQNPLFDDVPFNRKALEQDLETLRYISQDTDRGVAIESIREFLNEYGIYLAIRDQIKNCRVRGALVSHYQHPAILLSNRFHRHDHFWFALSHEIGHLMLHYGRGEFDRNHVDVGDDENSYTNPENDYERAANQYAREFLVNRTAYEQFAKAMLAQGPTAGSIREFASENHADPGIVRGFLQHDKIIRHNQFTELTTKW